MRVQNHFRVKGENIGQPEVIFRKISFFVTAKHANLGENDFLKSFSPKTNTPLILICVVSHHPCHVSDFVDWPDMVEMSIINITTKG